MPSEAKTRPARIAAQLRQEIARLIARDLGDPRLEGLVVANVTMTGDLRLAKVYWRLAMLAGPGIDLEARRKDAQIALERASGRLKRAATAHLGLRFAPELRFQYDAGQEARDRIDQLLEEVKREPKASD
ncbi:MAG: 30S ribosome-binding factor RbfA [Deltaproteobacteria bacterium]|nr:30S ribosome-binding factor RbfA [Deltaproteobacteria bacterium]